MPELITLNCFSFVCCFWRFLKAIFSQFRGGGSSRFRFFLKCYVVLSIFTQVIYIPASKDHENLSWRFLKTKLLLLFFSFCGNPRSSKSHFEKIENSKCSTGRNSQYFLTKTGLIKEKKHTLTHTLNGPPTI